MEPPVPFDATVRAAPDPAPASAEDPACGGGAVPARDLAAADSTGPAVRLTRDGQIVEAGYGYGV